VIFWFGWDRTPIMMVWFIFAAMAGGCALILLSRLAPAVAVLRALPAEQATDSEIALYKAQLAEIERDTARGLAAAGEADALRAEAGRRLLRAQSATTTTPLDADAGLRRRRWVAVLIMLLVPIGALAIYGMHGNPALPGLPLASRLSKDPAQLDVAMALSRIEAHLAANPNDVRGWTVIAPIYLRTGRYDDAVRAYSAIVRGNAATPDMLADLGEARVLAAGGVIGTEARLVFDEALKLDPALPKARFFIALASEQDGDTPKALKMLSALLAEATPDAPWRSAVVERLKALAQAPVSEVVPKGGEAIAALPEAERSAVIASMVEGLASRLNAGGGTIDEWLRLIRAQSVLGNLESARASLGLARQRLVSDAAAQAALTAIARDLKLEPAP
jgi:cytochrome c-type biogenesis protein CcmH